jgi:seryl-tRNA synthetase
MSEPHDPAAALRAELIAAGLLIDTGVNGLYGFSRTFEDVIDRFEAVITAIAAGDGAERMRFSPGLSRFAFERSGYLKSFPQLAGTVHSFGGGEREHRVLLQQLDKGEDWTGEQRLTEVVATPATCYPVYPEIARRGPLPDGGVTVDTGGWCFRHEPSLDPARMQMFRQREYVRLGAPAQVVAFRDLWLERSKVLFAELGLPAHADVANDPFFGRAGRMLAANQRESALKFELLVPVARADSPTALVSFNCHEDHFAHAWDLRTADGAYAHTACIGYGLERVAIGLFRHHGFDLARWPATVRKRLGYGT